MPEDDFGDPPCRSPRFRAVEFRESRLLGRGAFGEVFLVKAVPIGATGAAAAFALKRSSVALISDTGLERAKDARSFVRVGFWSCFRRCARACTSACLCGCVQKSLFLKPRVSQPGIGVSSSCACSRFLLDWTAHLRFVGVAHGAGIRRERPRAGLCRPCSGHS